MPAPPPPSSRRFGGRAVLGIGVAVVLLLAIAGLGIAVEASHGKSATTHLPLAPLSSLGAVRAPGPAGALGPEGVPIPRTRVLAPAGLPPVGGIDGIQCQSQEQVLFHIHAHLTLFVDGLQRQVPLGIGIGPPRQLLQTGDGPFVTSGTCFMWLHTHASDGIIHIESPVQRTYTLGEFFDVWQQPFSATRVGPARGIVHALYNGRVYDGNPRAIPLTAHAQIQLEVGKPLLSQQTIGAWHGL